jgi:hypothetical protein
MTLGTLQLKRENESFVSKLKEKEKLAPRARFELATLRLTVAALIFGTECDDLLSR